MPEEDVLGNEPQQPSVPDKGQGKDDTVTIPRSELESMRRERDEALQGNRDWAAHFRGTSSGKQPEPAGEPEDSLNTEEFVDPDLDQPGVTDDTPEKFVDAIAAQGLKAITDRGLVTKAEAQRIAAEVAEKVSRELIGRERQRDSLDDRFIAEFPEFRALRKDPEAQRSSPLWNETARVYKEMCAEDPTAKKSPTALLLSARLARATVDGRKPARSRDGEDDDSGRDGREDETERRHRADSQDSRTRGRGAVDDSDDMLGSEAKQVIKGFGITDAEFQASRKEVLGGRRRR